MTFILAFDKSRQLKWIYAPFYFLGLIDTCNEPKISSINHKSILQAEKIVKSVRTRWTQNASYTTNIRRSIISSKTSPTTPFAHKQGALYRKHRLCEGREGNLLQSWECDIRRWVDFNFQSNMIFSKTYLIRQKKLIICLALSALSLKKCAQLPFFIGNMPHIFFYLEKSVKWF